MAVAGDCLLDARGAITQHRYAAQTGGQQDHPSGVAHEYRRARMLIVGIELFYHDYTRPILFHYVNYTIVQHLQARRMSIAARPSALRTTPASQT